MTASSWSVSEKRIWGTALILDLRSINDKALAKEKKYKPLQDSVLRFSRRSHAALFSSRPYEPTERELKSARRHGRQAIGGGDCVTTAF